MERKRVEVIEAHFVVYEGQGPPDELTTGQYISYPRLVDQWCALTGAHLRPLNCVRFHFLTLQLRLEELAQLEKERRLNRPAAASEIVNRSGHYYVHCVPLTSEQVCWREGRERGLLIPRHAHIGCWSNEVAVESGERKAVIGSDGYMYTLDTIEDHVWSKREPRPNELRAIA